MVKVLIYTFLPSVALAGVISTRAEAQDYIVHTFQCPGQVIVRRSYESKIGSDPAFTRKAGLQPRFAGFRGSGWDQHQRVWCRYGFALGGVEKELIYEYTGKRTILSCKNVGKAVFTCNLKP